MGVTSVGEALIRASAELTDAIPEPVRFDAELLLAAVLAVERSELHRVPDRRLTREQLDRFATLVTDRAAGRPIAHLVGEWEFYSLPVFVTPEVLVPRPETELLVDLAIELLGGRSASTQLLDLCTGSGCVAIALATQLPRATIVATDVSSEALAVAHRNVERHALGDRVQLRSGDLFAPAPERFDAIVSNPPYVAKDDPSLSPDVARYEPRAALIDVLDGDGYGFYRRIAREARHHLVTGGVVLLEVGDTQATRVSQFFREEGFTTETRRDLAGIDRAVIAR